MGDSAANVAKDPVCGMSVDPATAAATREYGGVTYYFCNPVAPTSSPRTRPPTWAET